MVDLNDIDENYLPLHQYTLLAGRNFIRQTKNAPENDVIVNEALLKRFNIAQGKPDKALGQMLLTNQRLDKLAAAQVDFTVRGMLEGTCLSEALKTIGDLFFY